MSAAPPRPPLEVSFDADLLARTDPIRAAEWRAIARDMAADVEATFDARGARLHVTLGAATRFELLDADGGPVAAADVPQAETKRVIETYIDVVRQIEKTDQGHGSARLEALDMAKKLAHDDGARALRPHCRALRADHAACRHLFTLLVALRVDTTHLAGLRGHRRVR